MGLGNLIRNLKDRGLKDITNPEKIKAFLQWGEIKKNGLNIEAEYLQAYAEQVTYRMGKCPECMLAGECVHCHCEIEGAILTPGNSCSAGKWPQMLSRKEWEEHKKAHNIEIILIEN